MISGLRWLAWLWLVLSGIMFQTDRTDYGLDPSVVGFDVLEDKVVEELAFQRDRRFPRTATNFSLELMSIHSVHERSRINKGDLLEPCGCVLKELTTTNDDELQRAIYVLLNRRKLVYCLPALCRIPVASLKLDGNGTHRRILEKVLLPKPPVSRC